MLKSKILIVFFLTIFITGCTVYSELYIRNTTNIPTQISLISYQDVKGKPFEFMYADSLFKEIRYKTYNYLDKKLSVKAQSKIVIVTIPANATLHLGAGRNFQKQFEKMVIGVDTIDLNTTGGFQTSYEKFSKYAVWYDIK